MTNQELRNLYGCLKDRSPDADTLPSFAAVLRAKKEDRIMAFQDTDKGGLQIVSGEDEGCWEWSFGNKHLGTRR